MKAKVSFKIGEIEIVAFGGIPQLPNITQDGKDNMVLNSAISNVKKDLGIDLENKYPNIKGSATIYY
ncbi:hypothetical protein [Lysinibacillus fusiformis]|uniref:hypothetical protein n=1 Tax=Lysinibacillus fusiformis TaxID=28031 RepID=UPI00126880E0|nr:hypothetical protein [Lysinibacillus fusiformis]UXJ71377.1 hypothetical protein N5069_23430 [Lysinibacillus fusiformis]